MQRLRATGRKLRGWPVSRILSKGPACAEALWMTIPLRAVLPRRFSCQPGHSWAEVTLAEVSDSLAAYRRTFPREAPIRHCSGWGLPCRPCCQVRGGLLPHRFTLTSSASKANLRFGEAVCSLWRFPWGYPRRALPGTLPSWSPDFPRGQPFDFGPAVIQPSARGAAYACAGTASTGKRAARSAASAASSGESGPCAQGRKRRRKAASSTSAGASG